jgi:hypothetical protein
MTDNRHIINLKPIYEFLFVFERLPVLRVVILTHNLHPKLKRAKARPKDGTGRTNASTAVPAWASVADRFVTFREMAANSSCVGIGRTAYQVARTP